MCEGNSHLSGGHQPTCMDKGHTVLCTATVCLRFTGMQSLTTTDVKVVAIRP